MVKRLLYQKPREGPGVPGTLACSHSSGHERCTQQLSRETRPDCYSLAQETQDHKDLTCQDLSLTSPAKKASATQELSVKHTPEKRTPVEFNRTAVTLKKKRRVCMCVSNASTALPNHILLATYCTQALELASRLAEEMQSATLAENLPKATQFSSALAS